MSKIVEVFDPNELAKKLQLTEKQQKFADYFVFLTGLNGVEAAKLAGYKVTLSEDLTDSTKEWYEKLTYGGIARDNLNKPHILKYIRKVRENLEEQLIVDKLWVIQKLKELAEEGSENVKINALKLLGQSMEMFTEKYKTEGIEDPAKLAKEAFERRKNNVIPMRKDTDEMVG